MTDSLVTIIDDDEPLRAGLERLFRSVGHQTRAFPSVQSFLDTAAQDRPSDMPSCLVLDVRLPGMSGLEFQASFNRLGIEIPVIFMTGFGDVPSSVRAMKLGAVDFLPKPVREQELLDAVSRAIRIDAERRRARADAAELHARFDTLTRREREVMGHAVSGLMNKQIAGELGLSEVTVKIHRGSMMRKMGVRSIAELVRLSYVLNGVQ